VVAGDGLLAALMFPSGVEEDVIPAVMTAEDDTERGDRLGGARGASVEGAEVMVVGDSEDSEEFEGSVILTRLRGERKKIVLRCGRGYEVV
jgi:ribosomal protein L19